MIKITERRTSVPEQAVLTGLGKKAATHIGLIYCFLLHLRLKSQTNRVWSQPRGKKKKNVSPGKMCENDQNLDDS